MTNAQKKYQRRKATGRCVRCNGPRPLGPRTVLCLDCWRRQDNARRAKIAKAAA